MTRRVLLSSRFVLAAACFVLLLAGAARADARTAFLSEQLRKADDYRVRTQAALALGASADPAAVKPLCGALADSNKAVRTAAAAALGKLGLGAGEGCLKSAHASEQVPAVKAQMAKSLEALKSTSGAPPIPADAKFYVAIEVKNKTKRPAAEIEGIVRGTMQSKILSRKGYAIAPRAETPAQAGQVIKQRRLKGFFLMATVEPPVYQGGNLTQVVRVSMWTYPAKALQGEFAPSFTQEGTPKQDKQSETLLMQMCAEHAAETFQKVAASM